MNVDFNIFYIHVHSIESSAAMALGTNFLTGFGSSTKDVKGNGQINGDGGSMPALTSMVDDRDGVDSPNWEAGPFGFMQAGDARPITGWGRG